LAEYFPWGRPSVHRDLDEVHTPRPREYRLGYIYHPSFDDPGQEAAILAPMPGSEAYEAQRRQIQVPEDVSPELAPLYTPLLSREQEQHLFRKMNFLKHQANRLCDRLRPPSRRIDACEARAQDLDTIEKLRRQAQAVQALLVNCNMRLLVSIARRYATRTDNFSELLSDGNVVLISAVEKFDYSRGNKFSTYANSVLRRNFARGIAKEKHRRRRYRTGHQQGFFEAAVDTRSDEHACLTSAEKATDCVNRLRQLLEFLDPRERQIIRLRFGLGYHTRRITLESLGKQLGVTKERVRQLQARALRRLRNLAASNNVELA
jgi:RNA polymerase sigma factor (sigma-70 family)